MTLEPIAGLDDDPAMVAARLPNLTELRAQRAAEDTIVEEIADWLETGNLPMGGPQLWYLVALAASLRDGSWRTAGQKSSRRRANLLAARCTEKARRGIPLDEEETAHLNKAQGRRRARREDKMNEVDRLAEQILAGEDHLAPRPDPDAPGACWSCGDQIGERQRSVTYTGPVTITQDDGVIVTRLKTSFHVRGACRAAAERFEERWWINTEEGRARILTRPLCRSTLLAHADRSTECAGGDAAAPDCHGDDHQHVVHAACYNTTRGECPRGCQREGHPGCGFLGPPIRPRRR